MTDDTSGTGTGVRKDDDAGMGRMRMAMVKMGCKVNLDAPNTVSCLKLEHARESLIFQVCVTGALIYYTQGHINGGNKQGLELTGIQNMSLYVPHCPFTILIKSDLKGSTHAH